MELKNKIKNIKNEIASASQEAAIVELDELLDYLSEKDIGDIKILKNNLIVVSGNYNLLKSKSINGTIPNDTHSVEFNRISVSLLSILEQIENLTGSTTKKSSQSLSFYNVLIIGKAGVGKSSLVNYLFDAKIRETGIGVSITPNGFHKETFKLDNTVFNLYDSQGLDTSNSDKWKADLESELKNRGLDKSAADWFHTIIYCISASGSRVESFEINIINKLITEGYFVIIALTKADLTTENETLEFQKLLSKNIKGKNYSTVEICSEERIFRQGKSEKFGKTELIENIKNNFWKAIVNRLPKRCSLILNNFINKWEREQILIANYDSSGIRYWTWEYQAAIKKVEEESKKIEEDINREIQYIFSSEIHYTIRLFNNFVSLDEINKDVELFSNSSGRMKIGEINASHILSEGFVPITFSILKFILHSYTGNTLKYSKDDVIAEIKSVSDKIRTYVAQLESKLTEILISIQP